MGAVASSPERQRRDVLRAFRASGATAWSGSEWKTWAVRLGVRDLLERAREEAAG
jgi:hypothetical protein